VKIQVRVKPNSRVAALDEQDDGTWLARIKSPPVDGRANAELIALIAQRFGLRKAQVSISSGAGGRMKLVEIDAATLPER
jgi:uncharacterized protein (TIGR00251 family)